MTTRITSRREAHANTHHLRMGAEYRATTRLGDTTGEYIGMESPYGDRAILLAEKGFEVAPRLHAMIKRDRHLKRFPAARRYFFTPDGKPLPVGSRLRNPALALPDNGVQEDKFHLSQSEDEFMVLGRDEYCGNFIEAFQSGKIAE